MNKFILSMSLLVSSLSATGCSSVLDLGDVILADAGVETGPRNYSCGYAMPGFNCDNGRSHVIVAVPDMTSAIAMCGTAKPMASLESCHVIDLDGEAPTDAFECKTASGSWRPGNSCCNFKGTLSCP
jgi:hypothetical protein